MLGDLDDIHRPVVLSSDAEFMNRRWLTSLMLLGIKFGMGIFREIDEDGDEKNTALLLNFLMGSHH